MNAEAPIAATERPKIVIVEDEWMIAREMQRTLERAGFLVAAPVAYADALLPALATTEPDLVLMDIATAEPDDGLRVAERVVREHAVPVVFVSGHTDPRTLARAARIAPRGFVCKPFAPEQLIASVRMALTGRSQIDLVRAQRVLASIAGALQQVSDLLPDAQPAARLRQVPGLQSLSPREWEVLRALLAHRRPTQIAKDLFISPHTVRNHLKSIYAKLGVHSEPQLLELLVGPPD